MKHKTILRVSSDISFEKERYRELFQFCKEKERRIDEIIFFTQCSHSVQTADKVKKRLDFIGELFPDFRALGMKVGIDILCTLGHHEEHISKFADIFDFYEDEWGIKNFGRLCSSSEKTKEYIRDIYTYAASLHPDTIHIDDDLHYVVDCRCKNCERIFKEKYNLNDSNRRVYTKERLCNIFKIIEDSVHSVSPNTVLGWMTCHFGTDETDYSEYAEILKGDAKEILWRPGGGVYSDNGMEQLINKAHSIGRQVATLPSFVKKRYSEIENFPYFPLDKNMDYMKCEVLTYISAGCNSTAFNVFSMYSGRFDEYMPALNEINNISSIANLYVDMLGDTKARGIGKIFSSCVTSTSVTKGDDIYSIGIPPSYSDDDSLCYIITGDLVQGLGRGELLRALKCGAMLDAEALDYINGFGLGEYTGFCSTPVENDKFLIEKSTNHELNEKENELRDVHTSFIHLGHTPKVHRIQKTDDTAKYLTSLIDYDGEECGFASGIFENSLGGRIYVSGYSPFNRIGSKGRTEGLKRICKYITKDTLPAYISSFHKIALWSRGDCIVILNLASGVTRNVEIAVLTDKSELTVYRESEDNITNEKIHSVKTDGKYKIFLINYLGSQESVLCKII